MCVCTVFPIFTSIHYFKQYAPNTIYSPSCVHVVFPKGEGLPKLHQLYALQIFFSDCSFPFNFIGIILSCVSNFFSALMSQRCFHIFSYKCCNVLLFMYRYLTHLELIFEYGVRQVSNLSFSIWRTSCPSIIYRKSVSFPC